MFAPRLARTNCNFGQLLFFGGVRSLPQQGHMAHEDLTNDAGLLLGLDACLRLVFSKAPADSWSKPKLALSAIQSPLLAAAIS